MHLHLPRLLALLSLFAFAPSAAAQPADAAALRAGDEKRGEIDKVIARLAGADAKARAEIEQRLAELGKDAMVPLKLAALSDNFELRKAAIAMSARLRWRLACDPWVLREHANLVDVMAGSDPAARAALVDKIAESPPAEALSFFGECLADDQTYVRQRAIDGLLAAVEDGVPKQQVAPYLEAAVADPDRNIRVLAIGALAQVGGASLAKLTAMLNDESMEVRATIIQAIGRSREHAAVDHLKPLLKDPQWRIRAAALDAMAQLRLDRNSARVADAVVECLADEDTFVRGKAVKLLADWKYANAGPTLRKMLADKRIDEDTAFASLATLNDAEAVPLMLKAYENADALRRAQLLRWLSYYPRETRVAPLMEAAIKDEAMKAAWPQIIDMAAWREDAARFRPRLIELLLTGDEATTAAAWNALQRRLREQPLEPQVVDALFKSPDATRGFIAMHAAYITGGDTLEKALPRGLAHADARVIDLALVLTAHHYLKHTLGGELPYKPYGGDEIDEEVLMRLPGGIRAAKPKPQTIMTDALRDAVASHLKHADIPIRTRAAGILYRSEKVGNDPVFAVLRDTLKHEKPEYQRLGLIAIAARPAPFMGDINLEALAADEATSDVAIEIMAASGDAKYLDTIKKFAQNVNPDEPATILALIRSGQPEIIKIAAARVKTLEDYEQQRFHRNLRAMPGAGPVLFMEQFIDVNPRNRYALVETASIILTLPDPSVKPLLEKLAKAKIEDYGEGLNARITARLFELDPQATLKQLREDLTMGDINKQTKALEALLATSPTKEGIELAWEGSRAKVKDASPMWAGVANWLPVEEVEGRWIKELGTLHAPIQGAMLRRLTRDLKPAHLATLTAIGTSDAATREYLSALIAILTANDPAARPALDKVAETALPQVLSAAGEWGEAANAVDPYLMDARPAVADGARRGLALHLIGKPKAVELSDAHRDALVAGAMAKDDITAFLCAEALALHAPKALAAIEVDKPASDYTKLRLALLQGKDAPSALRETVKKHITSSGGVARALALRAAQKGDVVASGINARRDIGTGDMQPLIELAASTGDVALARTLVESFGVLRGTATSDAVIDLALAEARKDNARLFARMIYYIEDPAEGDLGRLIANAALFDTSQHEFIMNAALIWSPAAPSEEITKLIGPNSEAAILASAIAAIRWGDEKARQALVTAATRKKAALFGAALGRRRNLALVALRIAGKAGDVPVLLAGYKNVEANDRDEQVARMEYQRLVMRLAPDKAAGLLPPATDDDRFDRFSDTLLMGAAAEIALLTLDDAKWKPPQVNDEDRFSRGQSMVLVELLGAEKAAAGKGAKSPMPVEILPPWDSGSSPSLSSKRLLYEDAAALSGKQLETRIAMLRRMEQMEEQAASRPAGAGDADRPPRVESPFGLFEGDADMDDDDIRMRMMQRDFGVIRGSDETAEDYYGAHMAANEWAGAANLSEAALAGALKPFIESKWPGARIAAMRAAAAWSVVSLGDAAAKRLREGADERERVEAAWALAALRGQGAVKPIDEARLARDAQREFGERVRLACLLRALGSDVGRAEIERAIELRAMRALRLRFTTSASETMSMNAYRRMNSGFGRGFDGYEDYSYGVGGDPLEEKIEPWSAALRLGAEDLLRGDDVRRSVKPEDADDYEKPRLPRDKRVTPPTVVMFASGKLGAIGASPRPTPLDPLVGDTGFTAGSEMARFYDGRGAPPRFMLLLETEQALELLYFVQFADVATDTMDLRDKWLAWLKENQSKPREAWMRQALVQATAELTHSNWWHRLRAARRIMRLTGAKIAPPNPFDLPAWKALQSEWAARGTEEVPAILLKHALDTKAIAALPDGGDRAALLRSLIQIAGRGPAHLSEAALLHLHAWPDEEALLRAALEWQQSPRRELAAWVRDRMHERTGRQRVIYAEADLAK